MTSSTTIGLIAEYNPFHNGHAYQLAKLHERYPEAAIVVMMSGSFAQRGLAAVADKWTRAAWAVQGGADLVLELPYAFACRSAEHFATGGVQSLAALGCVEALAFGAEAESIETLEKAAACMDDVALQDALHERIQKGASYATAMSAEVAERTGVAPEVLRAPNNILGIEYLRAVRKFAPEMEPLLVQRVGAGYHDEKFRGNFASASAIRAALNFLAPSQRELSSDSETEGVSQARLTRCTMEPYAGVESNDISPRKKQSRIKNNDVVRLPQSPTAPAPSQKGPYIEGTPFINKSTNWESLRQVMPEYVFDILQESVPHHLPRQDILLRPLLSRLLLLDGATLSAVCSMGEGLEHRLLEMAQEAQAWEGLVGAVATSRYPRSRIARLLVHVLTGFSAEEAAAFDATGPRYLRVLAMNARGAKLLHRAKKTARLPIVTKTSQLLKSKDLLRPCASLTPVQQLLRFDVRATELRELAVPERRRNGADFRTSPLFFGSL